MFTLLVMVVFAEAGHRHGFQALDTAHDDGMESSDIAGIGESHHLTKRAPFFLKMMKFIKKKLNPLPII